MHRRDLKTGMDVIGRAECLQLLDGEEVGRVGVIVAGRPEIFPVNYVLDGEEIVFWTGPGTKLAGLSGAPVVFEVDHLDRSARNAWSVIVHGEAHRGHVARTPTWWVVGAWTEAVRIAPHDISGRRIVARA